MRSKANIYIHGYRYKKTFLHPYGFFYYETIKREINKRLKYECRCDERLKTTDPASTRLTSSQTLCCSGTGTPKDKDEVNGREFCEFDG